MAEAEVGRKRPFGVVSLIFGSILVAGVVLLIVGEVEIALRVQHEQLVIDAKQEHSAMSFSIRSEIHDFFLPGLAYVPLHFWVIWAGFRLARGQVARHKRAGGVITLFAMTLLASEHVLRAWLGRNGVYIGIPMNVFIW